MTCAERVNPRHRRVDGVQLDAIDQKTGTKQRRVDGVELDASRRSDSYTAVNSAASARAPTMAIDASALRFNVVACAASVRG